MTSLPWYGIDWQLSLSKYGKNLTHRACAKTPQSLPWAGIDSSITPRYNSYPSPLGKLNWSSQFGVTVWYTWLAIAPLIFMGSQRRLQTSPASSPFNYIPGQIAFVFAVSRKSGHFYLTFFPLLNGTWAPSPCTSNCAKGCLRHSFNYYIIIFFKYMQKVMKCHV